MYTGNPTDNQTRNEETEEEQVKTQPNDIFSLPHGTIQAIASDFSLQAFNLLLCILFVPFLALFAVWWYYDCVLVENGRGFLFAKISRIIFHPRVWYDGIPFCTIATLCSA